MKFLCTVTFLTLTIIGYVRTDSASCRNPLTPHRRFFTFSINNILREPYFNHSIVLPIKGQGKEPLVKYMECATLRDSEYFRNFTLTFTSPYGFFINSINGVTGTWNVDQTYWSLINQDGFLSRGVSTYIPELFDHVVANFTVGGH